MDAACFILSVRHFINVARKPSAHRNFAIEEIIAGYKLTSQKDKD